jgi:NADPH:quinone reductase-like Zn-dependent oxidoreductase
MIIGAAGGVGIHAVQMARLYGGWVIAVDTSDEKLAKTKEFGANAVINASSKDVAEEAKRLTGGRGVDVVIDFVCTSGTMDNGLRSLGRGGRLIFLARGRAEAGEHTLTVLPGSLLAGELIVTGSRGANKQELAEAIKMVAEGRIKPVITQRFSMEEAEQAHKLLDERKIFGRAVMVM